MFSRKINLFEKILLPVGVAVTVFGFYLMLQAESLGTSVGWVRLIALFTWLLLLFSIITTAAVEDVKEELALISREHVAEIKLLREFVHDELQEIRSLRQDLVLQKAPAVKKKN